MRSLGFLKSMFSLSRKACLLYERSRIVFFTTCFHDLLHGNTEGYQWLHGVTGGYKGLQEVTRGYSRLQGITGGYKGLQKVTSGNRGYKEL